MERQICEVCAGDEKKGILTPYTRKIKGLWFTWYFHNRHNRDCLYQFIQRERKKYERKVSQHPEEA